MAQQTASRQSAPANDTQQEWFIHLSVDVPVGNLDGEPVWKSRTRSIRLVGKANLKEATVMLEGFAEAIAQTLQEFGGTAIRAKKQRRGFGS